MIFTWQPDAGTAQTRKPNVYAAQYGGYEQRSAGLNADLCMWSVKFTRNTLPVAAFLRARGGVEAFTWTPPLGESGFYVCREWKHDHIGGDVFVVSGLFEQVMG